MSFTFSQIKHVAYWIFLCLAVVLCGVGILCFPSETAGGVASGMSLCLYTLIPSTFPFVVLSAFCVYSGASRWLGKLLGPITRFLFHLPGCCGIVILLGWIGGYPTGARGVVSLYKNGNISRSQGERMLWFCTNPGPSFLISVIGMGLYGDFRFGLLLFLCQTAAVFLIGVVSGIYHRITDQKKEIQLTETPEPKAESFSNALVLAANDGAKGAANLCSFVMLFTALMELLNGCGFLQWVSQSLHAIGIPITVSASIFPLVWEITSGVNYSSWMGAPLGLIAFFTAVGGLCVMGQILSTASPLKISKLKFLISRLLHGGISFVLFVIFRPFFLLPTPSSSVFHNTSEMLGSKISSAGTSVTVSTICGVVLLLLCAVFLICNKKIRFEKNK